MRGFVVWGRFLQAITVSSSTDVSFSFYEEDQGPKLIKKLKRHHVSSEKGEFAIVVSHRLQKWKNREVLTCLVT